MKRQWGMRLAGAVVALLAAVCALSWMVWAQGDTPIVILDGSLTIRSGVSWAQYTGSGDVRNHPHTAKSVTQIDLTLGGAQQTIQIGGQACRVDVTYAGGHIVFSTGANGKGLTMRGYGQFHAGANANEIAHNNQNAKISHLAIFQGNAQVFNSDASGGTQITIHYQ